MLWCNYHLLLPVIISDLCLTIISCWMSGTGSLLSLLFSTLVKSNWIGGCAIGFLLSRINWNPIFGGNYQYILPRKSKKTQIQRKALRVWGMTDSQQWLQGNRFILCCVFVLLSQLLWNESIWNRMTRIVEMLMLTWYCIWWGKKKSDLKMLQKDSCILQIGISSASRITNVQ